MRNKFAKLDEIPKVPNALPHSATANSELEIQVEQTHEGKEHLKSRECVRTTERDHKVMTRDPNVSNIESHPSATVQTLLPNPDSFNDEVIDSREAGQRRYLWFCELCKETQQPLASVHKLIIDEQTMEDIDVCGNCCDCEMRGPPCNPREIAADCCLLEPAIEESTGPASDTTTADFRNTASKSLPTDVL